MPRSKKLDQSEVVYLAPETLNQGDLAERLSQVDDPEEALALLNARPTVGEYRQVLGQEVVDGPEGTTVLAPVFGERVVWVDEKPDDREDGSGYFEIYDGPDAEYQPKRGA